MYNSRNTSSRGSQRGSFSPRRPSFRPNGSRGAFAGRSPSFGSRGPSTYGAPRRFGSSRPNSGRGQSRRGRMGTYIPPEKYIKKAVLEVAPTLDNTVVVSPFSALNLSAKLKQNITEHGYENPMPIQNGAIPHILEGKDVVGIANTGTGKTGAFLIPLLERMTKREVRKTLIIVPTRELATQIFEELKFMAFGLHIFGAVCIGGGSMQYQIRNLRRNPQFVIGTPGRLKDFVAQGILKLGEFDSVVLDEVDRMVDMGFIQDITHLLSLLPAKRQSLFFSATVTPDVSRTIQRFAINPITVSVKTHETSDMVEQDIVTVRAGENKIQKLIELLSKEELEKVLIFGRTKRGVEKLANDLYDREFKAVSIHGDKPQRKREQAIRLFKDGVVDILVATDVAARGIDIDGITHVINFDEPATYEDYTHRIGRTGRANKKGFAYTFVTA